jgi:hypothetical protein
MTNKIAWFGTLSSICGSFLVAFSIFVAGYVAFLTGAVLWLLIALKRKDRALVALNAVFTIANVIGLIRFTS